jgi:hypothetical protein
LPKRPRTKRVSRALFGTRTFTSLFLPAIEFLL